MSLAASHLRRELVGLGANTRPLICSSGRAGSLLSSPPEQTSTALHWLITSARLEKKLSYWKEIEMLRNRLFNVLIAIALVILVALTVREAFATSITTSQTSSTVKCDSLPSRHSIHTEYVEEMGMMVTSTEDGPTGVDGGLMYLLSAYRTCSK
jgi:hypothetical protein